jgi:hypothetical protein
MQLLLAACSIFLLGAFTWTVRVLLYVHSGQYEVDKRLKALER